MPNRATARDRAKRAEREEAVRHAVVRAQRRRRIIAIVAVVVALLFVVAFVFEAAGSSSNQASSTSTTPTTAQSTTSVTDGPTIATSPGKGGAAITGATPCPAADGSSPRTTQFAQPPPTCIDASKTYDAVVDTTQGSFTFLLDTKLAPRSVNNFVVLARYHYWDGTPVSNITTDTSLQAGAVVNANGQQVGKTVGVVITPGTLAMAPVSTTSDAIGGQFLITIGDKATNLPPTTTVIGIMLDDPGNTLHKMNVLGTTGGGPTKLVTITSVTIKLAP
jgi:peptidyl-prolyl cis-trans isomerase B (cyclophilin B)